MEEYMCTCSVYKTGTWKSTCVLAVYTRLDHGGVHVYLQSKQDWIMEEYMRTCSVYKTGTWKSTCVLAVYTRLEHGCKYETAGQQYQSFVLKAINRNNQDKLKQENKICFTENTNGTFSILLLMTVRTRDTERNSQYLATSDEMSNSTSGPRQYNSCNKSQKKQHRY